MIRLMRNYKQKQFIFSKESTNDEIVKKIDWFLIDYRITFYLVYLVDFYKCKTQLLEI